MNDVTPAVSKEEQNWAMLCHLSALVGFVLLAVVALGALFFVIRAAIKISNGELDYRYPYAIRFLK
jgi:uncharacterized Tic20 family protein